MPPRQPDRSRDTLEPQPTPHKRISLAKIAIALAVILILAFGLCAMNLTFNGSNPPIVSIAIGVEIACLAGLMVIGILAIARSNNPTE